MQQEFKAVNETTVEGLPAGGFVEAVGLKIDWQNGPLGRGDDRKDPNGTFVETVIAAVKQRIEHYQSVLDGRFKCSENEEAINKLDEALRWLKARTDARELREVEGTHMP